MHLSNERINCIAPMPFNTPHPHPQPPPPGTQPHAAVVSNPHVIVFILPHSPLKFSHPHPSRRTSSW